MGSNPARSAISTTPCKVTERISPLWKPAIITDAGDKVDVVFKPPRNPFPRGVMVGRNAA